MYWESRGHDLGKQDHDQKRGWKADSAWGCLHSVLWTTWILVKNVNQEVKSPIVICPRSPRGHSGREEWTELGRDHEGVPEEMRP